MPGIVATETSAILTKSCIIWKYFASNSRHRRTHPSCHHRHLVQRSPAGWHKVPLTCWGFFKGDFWTGIKLCREMPHDIFKCYGGIIQMKMYWQFAWRLCFCFSAKSIQMQPQTFLGQVPSTNQARANDRAVEWEVGVCDTPTSLVAASCTACLSGFALIKDKSSLMGCRCTMLMRITPQNTHAYTSWYTSSDALQHLLLSASPSSLPLPSLHLRIENCSVLLQLPWLIESHRCLKKTKNKKTSKLHPTPPPQAFQTG